MRPVLTLLSIEVMSTAISLFRAPGAAWRGVVSVLGLSATVLAAAMPGNVAGATTTPIALEGWKIEIFNDHPNGTIDGESGWFSNVKEFTPHIGYGGVGVVVGTVDRNGRRENIDVRYSSAHRGGVILTVRTSPKDGSTVFDCEPELLSKLRCTTEITSKGFATHIY